ncbi:MAG: glycosyltransferase, partial [Chloroflexi bacterium]
TISIVTPSYNQGHFLEATIRSVLNQEYPSIEYIIIDGGSTDASVEIIRRYERRLSYWRSEPDRGQADAINTGLARATGDILGWLNSDDTLLPGALQRVAANFQKRPRAGVIYGDALNTDARGQVVGVRKGRPYSLAAMIEDNLIPQPAAFFSRQAWLKHGPLDLDLHYVMDRAFWLRIAEDMELHYVPETWATMRRHDAAKTARDSVQVKLEEKRLLDDYFGREHVPAMALAARGAAYGRLHYYLGLNLLQQGDYQAAAYALKASLHYQLFHRRVVVVLALLLSARLRSNRLAFLYPQGVQLLRRWFRRGRLAESKR